MCGLDREIYLMNNWFFNSKWAGITLLILFELWYLNNFFPFIEL